MVVRLAFFFMLDRQLENVSVFFRKKEAHARRLYAAAQERAALLRQQHATGMLAGAQTMGGSTRTSSRPPSVPLLASSATTPTTATAPMVPSMTVVPGRPPHRTYSVPSAMPSSPITVTAAATTTTSAMATPASLASIATTAAATPGAAASTVPAAQWLVGGPDADVHLLTALTELRDVTRKLMAYVTLNVEGFRKILKKFNKKYKGY